MAKKQPAPKPTRSDGRFKGYVYLGYNADGKQRRVYAYGRTKQELDQKILDIKINQALGQLVEEKIKLNKWSEKWIKNKQGLSERTQKMYRDNLDRYILPKLGDTYLTDIKLFHVQDLINDLSKHPRTAQIVLLILDQMFRYAIASELMFRNPAAKDRVQLPSHRAAPKRKITTIEDKAIAAADLTGMERVYVGLCLYAGLRKSEALGVMPSDIKAGKLTVARTVADDGSIVPYGKSESANRAIPVQSALKTILGAYKTSGLYLIHNKDGKPLTSNQYGRFWSRTRYRINKAAGGKGEITKSGQYKIILAAISHGFSAHILRHSFATDLAEKGYSPAEIQYLMGHSTARLAQEVYTHIDKNKITADRLDGKTVPHNDPKTAGLTPQ